MANLVREVDIAFPKELYSGKFANSVTVSHSQNEFILDFTFVAAPVGSIVSRVILTPRSIRNILSVLEDNIERYEDTYGEIK